MSQKQVTTLVAIVILVIWGLIFGFPESDTTNQVANSPPIAKSNDPSTTNPTRQETSNKIGSSASNDNALTHSFKQKRSGIWMEVDMEVTRLLADDNEGSRHQKFIAESNSGHTVLVSHNIDLADRVPISRGDAITLRGRYEWNERGGVLHWTHHDPRGKMEGGWIKLDGQTYR